MGRTEVVTDFVGVSTAEYSTPPLAVAWGEWPPCLIPEWVKAALQCGSLQEYMAPLERLFEPDSAGSPSNRGVESPNPYYST